MGSTPLTPGSDPFNPDEDRTYRALKAFILFSKGLFQTRPVGHWRWSRDQNETEIVITSDVPLDLARQQNRPAIIVELENVRWAAISPSQTMQQSFLRGTRTFSDLMATGVTFHCLGRTGEAARGIAWLLFKYIPLFRRQIQTAGRIHGIETGIQMGKESKPGQLVTGGAWPEWVEVSLSVPIYIQETTRISDTADSDFRTVAQAVTMSLTAGLGDGIQTDATATPSQVHRTVDRTVQT